MIKLVLSTPPEPVADVAPVVEPAPVEDTPPLLISPDAFTRVNGAARR